MIKVKFYTENTKLITKVRLRRQGQKVGRLYDTIFDPGSTMTTMSESLFNKLAYKLTEPGKVKIIGVNSESSGISTLIDFFEIGGVNLGNVRVVVGQLHPNFENSVILGMNVILWYNFAVNHPDKMIIMVERKLKTFDTTTRFTIKNITNINLAAYEENDDKL